MLPSLIILARGAIATALLFASGNAKDNGLSFAPNGEIIPDGNSPARKADFAAIIGVLNENEKPFISKILLQDINKARGPIIGDGTSVPIPPNSMLRSYDAGSEFHVFAHGFQGEESTLFMERGINRNPTISETVNTLDKLLINPASRAPSFLADYLPSPPTTQYNVWACYARLASTAKLPANAVIILHGHPSHQNLIFMSANGIARRMHSMPQDAQTSFQDSFMHSPETLSMAGSISGKKVNYTFEMPQAPLTNANSVQRFLKETVRHYHAYLTSLDLPLPNKGRMPGIGPKTTDTYAKEAAIVQAARGNTDYVTAYLDTAGANRHPDNISSGELTLTKAAVTHGNYRLVVELFKRGANKSNPKENDSLLELAVAYHQNIFIPLLSTNGANASSVSKNGESKFHTAINHNNVAAIPLLAAAGADVDAVTIGSPLIYAAKYGTKEAVIALLDIGAKIDKPLKEDGTTALMMATLEQRPEIALELLRRGAKPLAMDKDGKTPLSMAKESKQYALTIEMERIIAARGREL